MKISSKEVVELIERPYVKISEIRTVIKAIEKEQKNESLEKEELTEILNWLYKKEETLSAIYKSKIINYVPLKNGALAIGPRPTLDKIDELKGIGTTSIVTLLKTTEKEVEKLGDYIKSQQIDWVWFPLAASKLMTDEKTTKDLLDTYKTIEEKLNNKEKVFIHCAAGVHRTGSFTHGLLTYMNYSKEESKQTIQQIRDVTAREAVNRHWQWSQDIVLKNK